MKRFVKFFHTKKFSWNQPSHSAINGWLILFWTYQKNFTCGSRTGSLTDRFKSPEYHGWMLQFGAIRISLGTHSRFTFTSSLKIILKEGNAYGRPMFQVSTIALLQGLYVSGCHAICRGTWWHRQGTDRSVVREHSSWQTSWKTLGWRIHSEESGFSLDALSTNGFSTEGMYSAVIDILWFRMFVCSFLVPLNFVIYLKVYYFHSLSFDKRR